MPPQRQPGFIDELKRRNVVRVGFAYLVGAWLLIQIADTVFPYLGLPDAVITQLIGIVAVGFIPALVIAWVFEWTPDGVKRDRDVVREAASRRIGARKFDYTIMALLTIAVAIFSYDRFVSPIGASRVQIIANSNPAIAVLPFVNRSTNEDDVFFVDGVHDDILTSLAKIGSLDVISRTSVEQYRSTEKTMREIGAELGVTSILEGGIQRAGNRIRVTVQLIDVATDVHQWAETYDRELTTANIFSIQSEISNTIARALQATLSSEEQFRIAFVPTESLEAYEAYLLGNEQLKRRRGVSIDQAINYFRKAVELDPDFALAYVGLADSYQLLRSYSNRPWKELREMALPAAEKAIELDLELGEAYASVAMIHFESQEYELAGPLFIKALELSPNYATGHQWYSEYLSRTGNNDAAMEQAEIALRLDPLSPIINHIYAGRLTHYGRYEEAEARWKKAIEIDVEFARAYQGLSAVYFRWLGRLDEAAINTYKAALLNPEVAGSYALLANIYINLGDAENAERWLNEAKRIDPESRFESRVGSSLLILRGEAEAAAEIARRALVDNPRDGWSVAVLTDYYVDSGRAEEAVAVFESSYPEMVVSGTPDVNQRNVSMALVLARVYQEVKEHDRADLVLEGASKVVEDYPGNPSELGTALMFRLHAVKGENEEALREMRNLIDSGWRYLALYFLDEVNVIDAIREETEFIAMAAEVRADLARQRAALAIAWAAEFGE